MAKIKPKEFLMQKGEKIVLGLALAGLGLFTVMGVGRLIARDDPASKSKEFKDRAKAIDSSRDDETRDPGLAPLPGWVTSPVSFKEIEPENFRSSVVAFETVDTPSKKRDNPLVLGISGAQVDLVRAPVKAYEVLVGDHSVKIGVLKGIKTGDKFDNQKMRDQMKSLGQRSKTPATPPPPPPPTPGTPQTPPPITATGPSGGGRRGGDREGARTPATPDAARIERTLVYVPVEDLDSELAKPGVVPALSVYPIRMIVVQASFPLKEQLEVIRRALRLKTIEEAAKETAPPSGGQGPTFVGFEVERLITDPNGQTYDWAPYDHVANYLSRINVRKYADAPDDGLLQYFLRYDQMMAMPLPELAANLGIYPGVRVPAIVAGVKKLQDASKPPITHSDMQKKFQGTTGGNPFQPAAGNNLGGAAGGFSQSGPVIGIDARGMAKTNDRPGIITQPIPGTAPITTTMPELEHMLIRFLDVDIRPGFTYQYRIRVKMKNPNYNKKTEVARPDDALKEILTGPWVAIGNKVEVPLDHNIYAADPIAYSEKVQKEYKDVKIRNLLDNRNGEQPVVQFQMWTERVPIENGKSEPAGYWVVAEVPVNRGEYIGHRQLVSLPMWSSEKEKFILQELPKYKVPGAKDQPKGLLVDFSTQSLVVDYEGGKVKTKLNDRTIEDEAELEIMVLNPDGSVSVKKSGDERKETDDRAKREKAWYDWLEQIRKDTDAAGALTNPNAPATPFTP